jgi:hypothetical protein
LSKASPISMRKIALLSISVATVVLCVATCVCAGQGASDAILDTADSLFKSMKAGNFEAIWKGLSLKSKNTIVDDVYRAVTKQAEAEKSEARYSRGSVESDFSSGGSLAKSYWNAYVEHFKPEWVLEESRWEMGPIDRDEAEIVIKYRKGEGPVRLRMTRENGEWKVGLMETFGRLKQ